MPLGPFQRGQQSRLALRRPRGEQQEHWVVEPGVQEVAEQVDGGPIGPMEIVQGQDQRLPARKRIEQRAHGTQQAVALIRLRCHVAPSRARGQ